MATITLLQYLDSLRWVFFEKGMQRVWNDLYRIAQSTTGATYGSALLGNLVVTAGGAGGVTATSGRSNSGPIVPTIPDSGGVLSPTPKRLSNTRPASGFVV